MANINDILIFLLILKILTIMTLESDFFIIFDQLAILQYSQLQGQPGRIMIFETLITILTIDNLNS